MIRRHEVMTCDHEHCMARFLGPPLEFGGSGRQTDELLRLAGAEGWSRVELEVGETGDSTRHYCPHHRPRMPPPGRAVAAAAVAPAG